MKRVKSGCIMQTLLFIQKEDCVLNKDTQLELNREEVESYKKDLARNKTRYQITCVKENEDASITVCVKKHLNAKTDVGEYFS